MERERAGLLQQADMDNPQNLAVGGTEKHSPKTKPRSRYTGPGPSTHTLQNIPQIPAENATDYQRQAQSPFPAKAEATAHKLADAECLHARP